MKPRLFKDEKGATAVEYGILVALIALMIVVSVALVGRNLDQVFRNVANALTFEVRWTMLGGGVTGGSGGGGAGVVDTSRPGDQGGGNVDGAAQSDMVELGQQNSASQKSNDVFSR